MNNLATVSNFATAHPYLTFTSGIGVLLLAAYGLKLTAGVVEKAIDAKYSVSTSNGDINIGPVNSK